jgi:hypothetical protein
VTTNLNPPRQLVDNDDDGKVYFSWANQVKGQKLRIQGKLNMGSYIHEIDVETG